MAVLEVLAQDGGYGYEIMKKMQEAGLPGVNEATVYGCLTGLRAGDRVEVRSEKSKVGPDRRFYTLTDAGRRELENGRAALTSVLAGLRALGTPV